MINDKRTTIPWYVHLLLDFKPVHYATDGNTTLCIKYLFGKTYVLAEITADEDPA